MPFKKGKSGNLSGKPKGVKSEKTKAWEHLGDFVTEAGAERVKEILTTCSDRDFMFYFPMLIEYFKPKRARVDEEGDTVGSVVIIDS